MEDQVYNGINDYLRYVRRWVKLYDTPLTANSIKEYGSAVWNDWLARRYGRCDRPQGLGGRDRTPGPAASRSPPTNRRSAPRGASTSAATSRASPPRVAEWRTDDGLPRGPTSTRTCRARATCRSTAGR